jgi:hypothetical protein
VRCPYCSADNSAYDSDQPRQPKPGDYSMCADCGALCVFEEGWLGLRVRPLTEDELAVAKENPACQALMATFVRGETWQSNLKRWRESMKGKDG